MTNHYVAPTIERIEARRLLRKSIVFQGLEPSDLSKLESSVEFRTFEMGETVFLQSSPCTSFYIVSRGLVKVSICSPSGMQVTYLLAEEGEPLNLVGPFTSEPRLLAASTLSQSHLAIIPQQPFLSFVYQHPMVIRNIMCILGQAIDSANQRIIDMFEKPVDMRLRKVLRTLHRKFGNPLTFTSLELADLAGTTVESALRAMSRLRRAGLVRSKRREIYILDADELETQCQEILWV
ncbi:MAG: Crp/Fnr family transcriptional regulator [Desulfatiglandaceae bacterium]